MAVTRPACHQLPIPALVGFTDFESKCYVVAAKIHPQPILQALKEVQLQKSTQFILFSQFSDWKPKLEVSCEKEWQAGCCWVYANILCHLKTMTST